MMGVQAKEIILFFTLTLMIGGASAAESCAQRISNNSVTTIKVKPGIIATITLPRGDMIQTNTFQQKDGLATCRDALCRQVFYRGGESTDLPVKIQSVKHSYEFCAVAAAADEPPDMSIHLIHEN